MKKTLQECIEVLPCDCEIIVVFRREGGEREKVERKGVATIKKDYNYKNVKHVTELSIDREIGGDRERFRKMFSNLGYYNFSGGLKLFPKIVFYRQERETRKGPIWPDPNPTIYELIITIKPKKWKDRNIFRETYKK